MVTLSVEVSGIAKHFSKIVAAFYLIIGLRLDVNKPLRSPGMTDFEVHLPFSMSIDDRQHFERLDDHEEKFADKHGAPGPRGWVLPELGVCPGQRANHGPEGRDQFSRRRQGGAPGRGYHRGQVEDASTHASLPPGQSSPFGSFPGLPDDIRKELEKFHMQPRPRLTPDTLLDRDSSSNQPV